MVRNLKGLILFFVACAFHIHLDAVWIFPPTQLSSNVFASPSVAISKSHCGSAVAVWSVNENGIQTIRGAILDGYTRQWTITSDLSDGIHSAYAAKVAIDPKGNAIAVWWCNGNIQGALLDAGTTVWRHTHDLSTGGNAIVDSVSIGIDDEGNVRAIWLSNDGMNDVLQGAKLSFGSINWTPTSTLSQPGQDANTPHIAVDRFGNAVSVWCYHSNGFNWIVQGAILPKSSSTWIATTDLSSSLFDAVEAPKVCMDANGNAFAIWNILDGAVAIVQGAVLNKGSTLWQLTSVPSSPGENGFTPSIAVSPSGDAIAIWMEGDERSIRGATLAFGDTIWTPTSVVSASDGVVPYVVTDSEGNAFAIWISQKEKIQSSTLARQQNSWSMPVDLSNESGTITTYPQIAAGHAQSAVAIWAINDILQATSMINQCPLAPSGFIGKIIKNKLPSSIDIIHALTWTPSSDLTVVGYRIYLQGNVIAKVSARRPCTTLIHNRRKNVSYTYTLVAFNAKGYESKPIVITLTR